MAGRQIERRGTVTINAFDFDKETLYRLSIARQLGLLDDWKAVDRVADGGAQLILSFQREELEALFTEGLKFQLSVEEEAFMREIIQDPEIEQYLPKNIK